MATKVHERPRATAKRRRGLTHGKLHGAKANPTRSALAHAATVGFVQLAESIPQPKLRPIKKAFEAGRPLKALAMLAEHVKPIANDDSVIAAALMRGAQRKMELTEQAGGMLSSSRAAEILSISPQALHKRQAKGGLIAVALIGGDLGYPAFQFESDQVTAGIGEILAAIAIDDPWMRLNFILSPLDELGETSPLDAIRRGETPAAVTAAKHFGEHGAS